MRSPWAAIILGALLVPAAARAQSNALANANRLFDAGRWPEAAVAMFDVVRSSSGPDKELAQYRLAIALYDMGLRQPAYAFFSEIADKPAHSKFHETLPWLAKLSVDLPEPADVVERVGKYGTGEIARFGNVEQRDVYARILYLHGRYAYRTRHFDDAMSELARVPRASPLYGKAQFYSAMASVQSRRVVPAVEALQRIVAWVDEAPRDGGSALRDLANLTLGRAYYSAAIKRDDASGEIEIDPVKLSAAATHYRRVDVAGPYFLDAVFEDAWVHTMAGDYVHALGNVRMLSAPELPSRHAEAVVLEALMLFTTCQYDEATKATTRLQQTYGARRAELTAAIDELEKANDDERPRLVKGAHGAAADALADRWLAGYVSYLAYIDAEKKRFEALPASFKSAPIADDVRDDLELARAIVEKQVGDLAHERLLRARDELDEALKNGQTIAAAAASPQRGGTGGTIAATERLDFPAHKTTSSWPINGRATPVDPYGMYAAPIASKCTR